MKFYLNLSLILIIQITTNYAKTYTINYFTFVYKLSG